MHQQAFDAIARIIAKRETRRTASLHLIAMTLGLIQCGFGARSVGAQSLPLGSECTDDSQCAETDFCGPIESETSPPLTHCCRPIDRPCSGDADCCKGFVCANGICAMGPALRELAPPYPAPAAPVAPFETACTLVELYPGYPGYRGFVAGLLGSGEGACLEDLQRQFPWFDRDREDQENAAAAVRLGLAGEPADWAWENWLAIEAERGLPITCYTCAQEQIATGEPYRAAPTDPSDIRLLVGSFGSSNELVFRVAARNSLEMWQVNHVAATDYQLRALAWTAYPGRQLNAWDLQLTYDAIATVIADGQLLLNWSPFAVALTQGGYAPTPSNAAYEDQLFLMATALEAQARIASDGQANALRARFNALVREWMSERMGGATQGLGEFLCPQLLSGFPGHTLECPAPSTQ